MSSDRMIQVLQVGPALDGCGGMSTVQAQICALSLENVRIAHVTTHRDGTALRRLVISITGTLRAGASASRFDVLHLHLSFGGSVWRKLGVSVLARVARTPYIIHAHGSDFDVYWAGRSELARRVIRAWLNSAHKVLALSKQWQDFYTNVIGVTGEKVQVLPNMVSVPAEPPARPAKPNVEFLFLGRLGERKGTWDLLLAFQDAHAKDPSVCLTLAGDGETERAREWVADHRLQECVCILGWVDAPRRCELLARADVFVLPSYREGLPVALLEAQAAALPVIATPVGGIPEVLTDGEHGLIVPVGNPNLLSAALLTLASDTQLRRKMGIAAHRRVAAENSEDHLARSLTALYREVARSPKQVS